MTDGSETTPGRLEEVIQRERKKVRWDPTINAGHIISAASGIASAIVMVTSVYNNLDKRLTLQESTSILEKQVMREKIDDMKTSVKELASSVNELRRDLKK